MKGVGILSGAMLLALAQAADATVYVEHTGNTNPGTEGFTNDVGGPVFGSPVSSPPAWNMTGPWGTDYNQYALSSAQVTALSSENWKLTAIMQNLSTGTGDESGIYADVLLGLQRYDIDLQSDGAGNQVLSTSPFSFVSPSAQTYTIAGLGTDYATFVMAYNAHTGDVDYYVNGSLVISNWPGFVNPYGDPAPGIVIFGGTAGNFRLVSLTTGVPEPSTWAMMLAGFAGLGLAGYRRVRSARAAAAA